jgi:predicted transcriptional regulator
MNMTGKLVFRIGVGLEEIDREIVANVDAAVAAAAADQGESIEAKRTVSFENWTTFFRCMTPDRIAILEHIATHDMIASTRALSIALGRDYSGVHADVAELVKLGLLERDGNALRCEIEPDIAELTTACSLGVPGYPRAKMK